MTDKRIFELVDGSTSKFWEVWRDGSQVVSRSGTTGAGGHTKMKDTGSAAAAEAAIAVQIEALTAKGYAEAGATPAKGVVDPIELAAQLALLPPLADDPAYLVFADWLQARGDRWGELITLQHQLKTAPAKKRAALEKAQPALVEAVLGPLAKTTRVDWHLGFARAATLETTTDPASIAAAIDALLAHPVAHMLTGVVLHPLPSRLETVSDWDSSRDNIVDPWTDLGALVAKLPPRVTHLGFGGLPASPVTAYIQMPSFTAITEHAPNLRKLELTGSPHPEPGTLALPELVELDVRYANATDLAALAGSELPALERVSVWLGGYSYCILDDIYDHEDGYPDHYDGSDLESLSANDVSGGVSATNLEGFLAALPATVKHVGIQSAVLDGDMIATILAWDGLGSVESLDLSGGTLTDPLAKPLLAAKKSLAHLELGLERNALTAAMAKKLRAALPKSRVDDQRKKGARGPDLFFRYVATME